MSGFYARDLAYVHDAAFGDLARAGAATLIGLLDTKRGTVVELGCGSGISSAALTEAGYDVLGVDVSSDLLAIARRRAPEARFVEASMYDVELPRAVALTAFGECLSYAYRPGNVEALFERVHAALEPGGVFLLDVATVGRETEHPRRAWHEGPDWTLCLEASEQEHELRRRIIVFREADGAWRRSEELHVVRLFETEEVLAALAAAGFEARRLDGYGDAVPFRRGHQGFAARQAGLITSGGARDGGP
jgi:SAM-dependent methyltransferase